MYLAAVREYLVAESVEFTGNEARDKRLRISLSHFQLAVRRDEKMSSTSARYLSYRAGRSRAESAESADIWTLPPPFSKCHFIRIFFQKLHQFSLFTYFCRFVSGRSRYNKVPYPILSLIFGIV